ncbi:hypothetical protein ASPZODRAFT_149653 [Penicilliopsis zonata CBS 506.65]|uniref:Ketoreductase (KR) domain-containing protein n=1 Tax=Penicilliopsis zonata CBS 506.65 TaxID=1073090 RepID=A0A1L9ST27_9EURO|nr:hypothetical protein ASPZODRAFT_149653 [Penicilliopsis zonata CBS 506.65]OJJ50261.1 hypothetical protein ASPZODRAFT_149653 [Penicilliopsis zonata CBS 506.65]
MSIFQQIFPPSPTFTEKDIPDQTGRVFIITGGASGIGFEAVNLLYAQHAAVYIATRSVEKIKNAIETIKAQHPSSHGRLESLIVDLADLRTIKPAVLDFQQREPRLDVVVHNAGVMMPPRGSTTAQGHDLEMGTNCLGPFLLQHYLQDIMCRTAGTASPGSVRVVWLSSMLGVGTVPGGIEMEAATGGPVINTDPMKNYMQSKVGNVFLAHEVAQRLAADGILSVSVNPGLMKTDLQRHMPPLAGRIMKTFFKPAKWGAYTELYAALSPDLTLEHSGGHIIPWGRYCSRSIPEHIANGLKGESEGGTGTSEKFWQWCEGVTEEYQ